MTLAWNQSVWYRLLFTLAGGYEYTRYFSIAEDIGLARNDNYFFVRPSLNSQINRWLNLTFFYEHRLNDSDLKHFSFDDNVVGAGLRFFF